MRRAMLQKIGGASLPNFSGYGITRLFAFFKTNLANYDYFMRIGEIGGDGTVYYVFFDENGTFSDSSPVSVAPSTTPTSTTISDIKGTSTWGLNAPICQITGLEAYANNSQSTITQATVIVGGVIILESLNNKPSAIFNGNRGFNNNTQGALPELANDQNWSQLIVCNPDNDNDQHSIASVTMASAATSYLDIFCDRRSNKIGTNIVTASGTYEFNFIDTQADTLTKNVALTFDGTSKDVDLYLNGENQESQTIVGTYTNTIFRIGGQHSTATKPLTGFWQMHIVANEKWDDTKTASLNTLVNASL